MTGDLLGTAASALRDTAGAVGAPRGDETLARVLRDVRATRRRRRTLGVVALPFALVLTGVGAWAATSGHLGDVARRIWPARAASSGAAPRARAVSTPVGPEIVPLAPAPALTEPVPARRVALLAHPAAGRAPLAAPSPPAVDVAPAPSADALYRAAHEAHFVRRDFEAALALWDRYLALVPLPPLALEARYDRAIALFRLGRRAEATRALRPFADGDYGSYRTAEARALLEALVSQPSGPGRGP